MKIFKLILIGLLCGAAWNAVAQQSERKMATLTVHNVAPVLREQELLVITRSFAEKKLVLGKHELIVVKYKGKALLVQYDDLDNNGVWDEAVFQFPLQPKETVQFTIEASEKPAAVAPLVTAHVRHRLKQPDNSFGLAVREDIMPINHQPTDFSKQKLPAYLTEGPAWENDKVGFRKYFDVRNANDIWGKTTSKMILDEAGTNPDSSYHKLSWWGMDILKVGKSLGAGAIALKFPLKHTERDTLIRMGSQVGQVLYRVLADGPVRAMFTITYKDCQLPGYKQKATVIEKISIWGGQYFFQNEVMVMNAPNGTKVVTGIPDFYSCAMDSIQSEGVVAMYSLGKQSENNDTLAMAVMVPAKNFDRITAAKQEMSDIANTFLIGQHSDNKQTLSYRFFAFWQRSGKAFSTQQQLIDELQLQAACMHQAVTYE